MEDPVVAQVKQTHDFATQSALPTLEVSGPAVAEQHRILTPAALAFVADLVQRFHPQVQAMLEARKTQQAQYDAGTLPQFPTQTPEIADSEWRVAPIPQDLLNRRVEITGPVDRKMIINALNSRANVFMADFEDSTAPSWSAIVSGQVNLYDAVRRTIAYTHPVTAKHYSLGTKTATLMVRPRGWHLSEAHLTRNHVPVPASLVDFGLFFFHNARELIARGSGPYFYLPKLQGAAEAALWNEVFVHAQQTLGIPVGTIRATVLLETLPAAFEMEEILFALKEHSAGLNCGRWDYIFSFIKTLRNHPEFILPDRSDVGMTQLCMRSYTRRVIQICHRRGAHAMGGMAAQIPIKNDPQRNEAALQKVRVDKLREVTDGHDGTWVAHPGLVSIAREIFDAHMPTPNQIDRPHFHKEYNERDLLAVPTGTRTEAGLQLNIDVGIRYLAAWLNGLGCVPIYNCMEDAATAEISRAQVWQWIRHGAALDDGRVVTKELFAQLLSKQMIHLKAEFGSEQFIAKKFPEAGALFAELCTASECPDFLTLPAYGQLVSSTL